MTSLLVVMLMTAEPVFPLSTTKEVHVYPSLFTKLSAPLDAKLFAGGPWFAGLSREGSSSSRTSSRRSGSS